MILMLASPSGNQAFKALCAWRPLVFLGEISYSVYLLQWFIWIGWKHVLAKLPVFAAHPYFMVLCAAGTVIACATASHYLFERPVRDWIRGRRPTRRTIPAAWWSGFDIRTPLRRKLAKRMSNPKLH